MTTPSQKAPPVIPRRLDLKKLLAKKSHFLLGPRQTGKSFLIRQTMPNIKIFNLLDTPTLLSLGQNPKRLSESITPKDKVIVIDEIQLLPSLLNEIQLLIEEKGIRFLLTGSSARKLRSGGVNLLGGRARTKHLHPLTRIELGTYFKLDQALYTGLLPSIYFSDDPDADLAAYAGTYLKEEIIAEGLARNAPAFSRFLEIAALSNAQIINFTKIASDAQVPRTTIYEYIDILKDTLIARELPAWKKSKTRKPLSSSKYYFFDTGIVRTLQDRRRLSPKTPEYGEAFETYLFHELSAYADEQNGFPLNYWRSTSGFEVDFILADHTAIEVKANANVSTQDLKGLEAIGEEQGFKHLICVSCESRLRKIGKIQVLPYTEFLDRLWAGEFI